MSDDTIELTRCQTSVFVPDPNDPDRRLRDQFAAHQGYTLTLCSDGTLTVRGRERVVHTTAAWWEVADRIDKMSLADALTHTKRARARTKSHGGSDPQGDV